jgi:hypothetical protein
MVERFILDEIYMILKLYDPSKYPFGSNINELENEMEGTEKEIDFHMRLQGFKKQNGVYGPYYSHSSKDKVYFLVS